MLERWETFRRSRLSGRAAGTPAVRSWLDRWEIFRTNYLWAYLFIAPTMILLSIFLFYPLFHAAIISFQDLTIQRGRQTNFVGFDNYIYTLRDPVFRRSFLNTAVWSIGTVSSGVIISLTLAWLIYPLNVGSQNFFKAAYYLPSHIGGIMVALVWYWMFDPMSGLMNYFVGLAGLDRQLWLRDARTIGGVVSHGLLSMMLIPILGGHGGGVILYLAAMGGIPASLYEAADIDATSAWRKLWRITWPLLRPTTLYVIITGTIGSFQVFDLVYLLTRGGPVLGTVTIVYQVYVEAFERYRFGVASAQAFILGVIIITLSLIQFRLMASDVEY